MDSKTRTLTVDGTSPPLRIHRPHPWPPEPPEPTCGRCGRANGRTYPVTPSRRYCWPCFDRHLTNLPSKVTP